MTLPNFLILGAQKAGTTPLYHALGQHPEIFTSPVAEPHYFSLGDLEAARRIAADTVADYRKLFAGAGRARAVGEASTTYLESARAARRIRELIPEARLIAVLRDPAERAHAHYLSNRRRRWEDEATFSGALELEPERLAVGLGPHFNYVARGFYHAHLAAYHRHFDRRQIRVFLYQDFEGDPSGVRREIFRFLEVDDGFAPDTTVERPVSGVPRNEGDLRRELIEIYRDDVLRLEDLIGRDLSAWLRVRVGSPGSGPS